MSLSLNLISTSLCFYLKTITIGSLPSLFNFCLQYHKLSLIYNKTFSIAYEHSSSFFLAQNIPGVFFFLNNPNFYQLSQQHFPIQNNSKSESANPRHTWFRQNSAHLLIISKTPFQNIFPNNNRKAPLQGELTEYLSDSSDTKKTHLSLSYSASTARPTARPFSVDTDHDKSEIISMSPIIGINNFLKETGLILPPPKISILPTSQNIEKVCAHSSDKHQCAQFLDNPIDAPKIPSLGIKFSFSITTWPED